MGDRNRHSPTLTAPQRACLGLICLVYVGLALAANLGQPLWEAPDEPAHFGYIRYLQDHHALPRATTDRRAYSQPWNLNSEYSQAPLYYIVAAALLSPIHLGPADLPHLNPYVAWPDHPWREAVALHRTDEGWPYTNLTWFIHLGRFVSTLFGLLTLGATFGLVLTLTRRASAALIATAFVSGTPVFLLTSARLDNDAIAMATGAITLWLAARLLTRSYRATPIELSLLSLSLAAALLSKLNDLFLIPIVLIAAFWAAEPARGWAQSLGRRFLVAGLVLGPPVALFGGWWLAYGGSAGAVVGTKAGFGVLQAWTVSQEISLSALVAALANWNATWWGGIGWGTLTLWPDWLYLCLATPLFGVGLIGLFRIGRAANQNLTSLLLTAGLAPLFYATLVRAAVPSVGLDSNARFTLPALPVLALLIVEGLSAFSPARQRRWLTVGVLGVTYGAAVAIIAISLPQIPRPAIPARLASSAEAKRSPLAAWQNGIELLAVDHAASALRPGTSLPITLKWRVTHAPPDEDFTAYIQLIDATDRALVVGSDAIPAQPSFPPRLWQFGEVIEDARQLDIPADLPPGRYDLLVGAYHLRGTEPVPIPITLPSPGDHAAVAATLSRLPDASGFSQARPIEATFGADLQLRGYAIEPVPKGARVTLYWQTRQPMGQDLTVSVQFLSPEARVLGQHDGQPVDGRLPTSSWPSAVLIRDEHVVSLQGSDPAAGFVGHPIVVVYDARTGQRLPVTRPGQPPSDYLSLPD